MKSFTALLVLIAISCLAFQQILADEAPSDVLTLTTENFDKTIQENPLILVEFYAPWCGHCKHLAPEYEKAATTLKESKIPIAKVDADDQINTELRNRFQIKGFPTLKLFSNGVPIDYQGERTAEGIVSYMKKQAAPAVTPLTTSEQAKTFSTSDKVVVIGIFAAAETPEHTAFRQVANELRNSFTFGEVIGNAAIGAELSGEAAPSVVLFKKFDEGKNVLAAADLANLKTFINTYSIPLVDEIGPGNFKNYFDSGIPLAYLFVDPKIEGQKDQYLAKIEAAARSAKGKLNFVWIDWGKYAKHSERLGLSGTVVPSFAIENMQDGVHYAFPETDEITAAGIDSFVAKFLAAELAPTIKSEAIPESNDGPVKVLVANNFDAIVKDATKDVLVEFYAPWCGHCKKLAPIFDELGTLFKSVPSVVIAKIDATANDVNPKYGVRGFPTLKFFPADNKEAPVEYEGDRSLADLAEFVKTRAALKFDLAIPAKEAKDEL